jgi:hypothetical protein
MTKTNNTVATLRFTSEERDTQDITEFMAGLDENHPEAAATVEGFNVTVTLIAPRGEIEEAIGGVEYFARACALAEAIH